MRELFPGYYPLTEDEKSAIWDEGLLVLDTNALFNLFRYTTATREAFLEVLRLKRDQLWLPYQVALEFQIGRLGIIRDQQDAFTNLLEKSRSALGAITTQIGSLRNHPTLDLDDLRATVGEAVKLIEAKITVTQSTYDADVVAKGQHDETTAEITDLYEGRVGHPYDQERLEEVYAEGSTRYEMKVPPGFKDIIKPEPERYGDLVLWFQILDKAESDHVPVIFVSDDQKEDWWREFKGAKIGPRVELVDEFMARVGKRVFFMTPQQLMGYAKDRVHSVTVDAVREVGAVSDAHAASDLLARTRYTRIGADGKKEGHAAGFVSFAGRAEGGWPRVEAPDEEHMRALEGERELQEARLRRTLERMRMLEKDGDASGAGYARLEAQLAVSRKMVIELSNRIKELGFREYQSATRPSVSPALIRRLRDFLMASSIPVVGDLDDWDEVTDSELVELMSPDLRRILGEDFEMAVRLAEFEVAISESAVDRARGPETGLEVDEPGN